MIYGDSINSDQVKPDLNPVLSWQTKLAYGAGELAMSVPGNILAFFLMFFYTNVVGLSPSWAGWLLMIGRLVDLVNDPLVGWLSDRTRSPWGRRYPWIMAGIVPYSLFFISLWWIPNHHDLYQLFCYFAIAIVGFYLSFTAVSVPYASLAAELTQNYDQRISLISVQSACSLSGGIGILAIAYFVFSHIPNVQNQYLLLGWICAVIITIALLICVYGTYPHFRQVQQVRRQPTISPTSLLRQLPSLFRYRAFICLFGLHFSTWFAAQLSATILPYFVVHWLGLNESTTVSAVILAQVLAVATIGGWNWVGNTFGKKAVYLLGTPLWVLGLTSLIWLQPGQVWGLYLGLGMAGLGLPSAYVVPWSMLPDVIDLDELTTGYRREGLFYSVMLEANKLSLAIAVIILGYALDWSGFIAHHGSVDNGSMANSIQPDTALWTIRWIMGPISGLILVIGMVFAYFYPISRDIHQRIISQLHQSGEHNQPISESPTSHPDSHSHS